MLAHVPHTHLYSKLRADCVVGHYFRPICAVGRQVCMFCVLNSEENKMFPKSSLQKKCKCSEACNLFDVNVSNTLISKKKISLRVEQGFNYTCERTEETRRGTEAWAYRCNPGPGILCTSTHLKEGNFAFWPFFTEDMQGK